LLRVLRLFPSPDSLLGAPWELIQENLGEELAQIVLSRLLDQWDSAISAAQQLIGQHLEKNVVPVALTDPTYPPLLALIPDPAPLLFARGNIDTLASADSVAIVGTRDATERGKEVASRIAKYFGKSGYVIVSGLAKGIDTAAHSGAIEAGAKTVAVLGTALDQIYPAENRPLADRIADDCGVLVTELPLGRKSSRNAFVLRDRIQSGMSLAVIPVQTDIAGGTMHTVKFAEAQGRLLFCPKPLESEQGLKQYTGIFELIQTNRAREFQGEDYESLLMLLQEHKKKLLSAEPSLVEAPVEIKEAGPVRKGRGKKRKKISHELQAALEFAGPPPDALPSFTEKDIDRMVEAVRQLGLDSSVVQFDEAVSRIRKRIFGRKKPKRSPPTNAN
jgi:DNA processing protein